MFTKNETLESIKAQLNERDERIASLRLDIKRLEHERKLADEVAAHQYKLLLEAEKAKLVKSHREEIDNLHDDYRLQIKDLHDSEAELLREIARASITADERVAGVEARYLERLEMLKNGHITQLDEVRRNYIKRESEVQVAWSDKLESSREHHVDQVVALAKRFGEKLPDVKVDLSKLTGDSTINNNVEV